MKVPLISAYFPPETGAAAKLILRSGTKTGAKGPVSYYAYFFSFISCCH